MVIIKAVVIIIAIIAAVTTRKQLLKDIEEFGELDNQVLRKALDMLPEAEEPENTIMVKVISPSPKTIREKLVGCLERILYKLKER